MIHKIAIVCLCLVLLFSSATTVRTAWALTPYQPTNISQLEFKAHTDYDSGKYLQAIPLLKQLLKVHPKNSKLLTILGIAENEISNFKGAIFYVRKTLAVDPDHIGDLVGIGFALQKLAISSAPIFFKEALKLKEPATTEGDKLERALAFIHLGNYLQALDTINQILKRKTADMYILGTKGDYLFGLAWRQRVNMIYLLL